MSESISLNNIENDNRNVYFINNIKENQDIDSIIKEYIKNNIYSKFDDSNFSLEINGVDEKYYDYVLNVDGIRTNLGYTAIVYKNNITIYDNVNGQNIDLVVGSRKNKKTGTFN